ncbi:hypothetical protein PoB_007027100 [Plakobranchus ocellatus]|uniref:Uncharacterized protein n=1 Tax=Plakobranchus ocellatus TaxID=259542 RepID=A0AAV4DHY3_9GAST|nr:hypothetical protein PoB_007027100 [Plakobranchus ocellatus]
MTKRNKGTSAGGLTRETLISLLGFLLSYLISFKGATGSHVKHEPKLAMIIKMVIHIISNKSRDTGMMTMNDEDVHTDGDNDDEENQTLKINAKRMMVMVMIRMMMILVVLIMMNMTRRWWWW